MKTGRWIQAEFADLKEEADQAGSRFREARRRRFQSSVQYYFNRQLLNIKPIRSAFNPSPAQIAQINAESVARVRYWDAERRAASVALDEARLNLDKAVARYREARFRHAGKHGS